VIGNEREQRQVAGSFDGCGQHPLMLGAGAGDPAGNYLAAFGHEVAELFVVLIVDMDGLIQTELAVLTVKYPAFFGIAGVVFGFSFQHDLNVFLKYMLD